MDQEGMQPQSDIIVSVLQLCTSFKALVEGKQVESFITQSGVKLNSYIRNNLLNMYAKCGSLLDARHVFDEMPVRDVVSWNTMITGYAQQRHNDEALKLFWHMQDRRVEPNRITFMCVLKACPPLASLDQGMQIHTLIMNCGLELDVAVGSAIVDMYAKFGSIYEARDVFDKMVSRDVVLWTSMIGGYAEYGYGDEALQLYQQMLLEGIKPDKVNFLCILGACTSLAVLEQGIRMHTSIIESGFEWDAFVGSALVDMYAKCGSVQHACRVFNKAYMRDVVSWTALISGYAKQEQDEDALNLFQEMKKTGIMPNEVTLVGALTACAHLAALALGKSIHTVIMKYGWESNLFLANALIDMYAKSGSIELACQVFNKMSNRDTVAWNTMIDGYAQFGNAKAALQLFSQMNHEGVKMDNMTFVGVLSACNHAGLVEEGFQHFGSMVQVHGIQPSAEHYSCIIDILGRAGDLEGAKHFFQKVPFETSSSAWMALLSACRVHGDIELGKIALRWIMELEPENDAAFVLLSNIYAATKRHCNANKEVLQCQ